MKRFLFIGAALLVGASTASADYVLIKININQLNFFPGAGAAGNFGMAGAGGQAGGPPGGGLIGGPPGGAVGLPGGPPPGGAVGLPGGPPPGGAGGLPGGPPPGAIGGVGYGGGVGGIGIGGGIPGGPGMPPPMGMPGGAGAGGMPMTPVEDPNARWVSAFVEIKNRSKMPVANTPFGMIFTYDHSWGKKNWMILSPMFPVYAGYIPSESFTKEFDGKFAKAKNKEKDVRSLLAVARWSLSRGRMIEFHKAMEEAEKMDPKHAVVKNYGRIKKALDKPFKDEDPAQREVIDELRNAGYKPYDSKRSHYRIYAQINASDTATLAGVNRRLALMEDTLDSFYYWFAMQEDAGREGARQPNLPKYRLTAILTASKEEFATRHVQWGQIPMTADGFTPRRDNVIVLSSKARIHDPIYAEYKSILDNKIQEANIKLQQMGVKVVITQEDLLSGKINTLPEAGKAAVFIGVAQTAVLLSKALEDAAEKHTVSNESVRQLLIASEMFPRNVQIPDWMVEGLAAFFETPSGALYPTVGAPSWTHLVSFKHFESKDKRERFAVRSKVLGNVITDTYFLEARQLSKEAADRRDSDDAQWRAKEAWELARCTSWAFVYYLAQDRKLHYLFRFGEELDKLPRDMDLNDQVLQGAFAKAFDMTDTRNARQVDEIKLKNMASYWFEMISGANLELMLVQDHYAKERAKIDPSLVKSTGSAPPGSIGGGAPMPPGGVLPPGGPTMPPIMPPGGGGGDLVGSTWTGQENIVGKQKDIVKVNYQFAAGGKVTRTYTGFLTVVDVGTWTKNGNKVSMKFGGELTGTTYEGTINAGRMDGTMYATSTKTNWQWSVTSGGAGGAAPPPIIPGGPPMPPGGAGGNAPGLLIQTTWTGTEARPDGNVPVTFKFGLGIKVVVENKEGPNNASFTHNGDQVSISWSFKAADGNDSIEYFGKKQGNTITGTVTKGVFGAKEKWNFTVTYAGGENAGGAAPPIMPPGGAAPPPALPGGAPPPNVGGAPPLGGPSTPRPKGGPKGPKGAPKLP